MPDDMDFETAASLPTIYATVYVSLVDTARLQRGETVLIHSATGGVGQAAVMLAQHLGADVFVTVGSDEKRRLVMDRYGIPADRIFFSRDASFAAGIRAATAGRGVDVVLNSLTGNLLQESVNCLAPFGRFVELGKRDLEQNHCLELEAFTRAVSFSSIDLIAFGEHKGLEANRILKDVMRLLGEKAIRPVYPITAFPISDAEKAFRLMQTGKHMGKIVLSVDPDVVVPVCCAPLRIFYYLDFTQRRLPWSFATSPSQCRRRTNRDSLGSPRQTRTCQTPQRCSVPGRRWLRRHWAVRLPLDGRARGQAPDRRVEKRRRQRSEDRRAAGRDGVRGRPGRGGQGYRLRRRGCGQLGRGAAGMRTRDAAHPRSRPWGDGAGRTFSFS
jgi:hypothetical protein